VINITASSGEVQSLTNITQHRFLLDVSIVGPSFPLTVQIVYDISCGWTTPVLGINANPSVFPLLILAQSPPFWTLNLDWDLQIHLVKNSITIPVRASPPHHTDKNLHARAAKTYTSISFTSQNIDGDVIPLSSATTNHSSLTPHTCHVEQTTSLRTQLKCPDENKPQSLAMQLQVTDFDGFTDNLPQICVDYLTDMSGGSHSRSQYPAKWLRAFTSCYPLWTYFFMWCGAYALTKQCGDQGENGVALTVSCWYYLLCIVTLCVDVHRRFVLGACYQFYWADVQQLAEPVWYISLVCWSLYPAAVIYIVVYPFTKLARSLLAPSNTTIILPSSTLEPQPTAVQVEVVPEKIETCNKSEKGGLVEWAGKDLCSFAEGSPQTNGPQGQFISYKPTSEYNECDIGNVTQGIGNTMMIKCTSVKEYMGKCEDVCDIEQATDSTTTHLSGYVKFKWELITYSGVFGVLFGVCLHVLHILCEHIPLWTLPWSIVFAACMDFVIRQKK